MFCLHTGRGISYWRNVIFMILRWNPTFKNLHRTILKHRSIWLIMFVQSHARLHRNSRVQVLEYDEIIFFSYLNILYLKVQENKYGNSEFLRVFVIWKKYLCTLRVSTWPERKLEKNSHLKIGRNTSRDKN